MATGQIVSGLGLDALIYTRDNPTGSTLHWQESPDGTRVLTLSPGGSSPRSSIPWPRSTMPGSRCA